MQRSGTFSLGGDTEVHRLGYGAMRLCGAGIWGHPEDPDSARRVLKRAVELGVQLIDTSDAYGPEVNEYQIAEALHPYDGLCIATKGGLTRNGPDHWGRDARPERLRRRLHNSLRRLRVDVIDLYQLHAPDPKVPLEDSVGALARAREEGLIRHVGLSNVSADELRRAMGVVPIASVQNRYNLSYRDSAEVLALCEEHQIAFLPWYPLAAGPLTRPDGVVGRIAAKHGASSSQVSLAWLLAKSPVILPIPGTSSVAHLEENCGAADLQLDAEDLAALEAVG